MIIKENLTKYSVLKAITKALVNDCNIILEYGLVFDDIIDNIQVIQEMEKDSLHVLVTKYSFLIFKDEKDRDISYQKLSNEYRHRVFFMRIDKDNGQYTLVY